MTDPVQPQPEQPAPPMTPMYGWAMGIAEIQPGVNVVVYTISTSVGQISCYASAEDARRFSADQLAAADKADQPQLLRPVGGLLGANGMPLNFPPGMPPLKPGEAIGPPQEQIPDEHQEHPDA